MEVEEEKVVEVEEVEKNIFVKFWNDICDFFRGIKTMIFGNALIVIGFLETFHWTDVIPDEFTGLWNLLIGLSVVWLRMISKGPARWFN